MVLLSLLFSCRCAPPPPEPVEAAHYAELPALLAALRAGDVPEFRAQAKLLEGDLELPEGLSVYEERLHGAVGFAVVVEDVEEMADAASVILLSCGGCHAAADAVVPLPPPPAAEGAIPSARHPEGADWIERGLIAPDEAALWAGAALYSAALPEEDLHTQALLSSEDRETAVAAWLTGCAGCHHSSELSPRR